ncbi:unnamed protein product [Tenebrio molitor]|nr:unnamed protein product [Tenebrio molitor]
MTISVLFALLAALFIISTSAMLHEDVEVFEEVEHRVERGFLCHPHMCRRQCMQNGRSSAICYGNECVCIGYLYV